MHDTQTWKIIPGKGPAQGRGVHIICADDPEWCLEIEENMYQNDTRIVLESCEGKANQTWQIQQA